MNKIKTIALYATVVAAGVAGFSACSSNDEEVLNPNVVVTEDGTVGVAPEFVLSIPRSVIKTRMSSDVVQEAATGTAWRGMDNIVIIPFDQTPAGGTAKFADFMDLGNIQSLAQPGTLNFKRYASKFVPVGTSNFLFYGKAIDKSVGTAITSMEDKFHYGVLNAVNLTNTDFSVPSNVEIGLERINSTTNSIANDAKGQAVLALLTTIANTTGWSTASNGTLLGLYTNFTKMGNYASSRIAINLSQLYYALSHIETTDPDYALSQAIRTNILAAGTVNASGKPMTLSAAYDGFPTNMGMPDGAARMAWNTTTEKFEYTSTPFPGLSAADTRNYTYPAALWYYVNTPIKASDEIELEQYDNGATAEGDETAVREKDWSEVISNVYATAGNVVTENTQSVALELPAQYAVGRLQLDIKMETGDGAGNNIFYDNRGRAVDVTNGYTLKGVLIGGQNGVTYDFTPVGAENLTIYDRDVPSGITVKPGTLTALHNNTLALETLGDQKINIALELINNGPAFIGKDGTIPTGGTFYMTAQLDPAAAINKATVGINQIFKQDYVTKVTVTIKKGTPRDPGHPDDPDDNDPDDENPDGPGGGENGDPDLSSDTVELGTSVDLEWKEGLELTPAI